MFLVVGTFGLFVACLVFLHHATNWPHVLGTVDAIYETCSYFKERRSWGKRRRSYARIRCEDKAAASDLVERGYTARGHNGYEVTFVLHGAQVKGGHMFITLEEFGTAGLELNQERELQLSRTTPGQVKFAGNAWKQLYNTAIGFSFSFLFTLLVGLQVFRRPQSAGSGGPTS